jgi:hypothetical protein
MRVRSAALLANPKARSKEHAIEPQKERSLELHIFAQATKRIKPQVQYLPFNTRQ